MKFLGHIVNEKGIRTDPEKVAAMTKLPPPKNLPELRSAMGLFGYYRSYVPNFSKLAVPLYQLFKKGTLYQWNEECQDAYNRLKQAMTKAPVLMKLDFNKPFRVYTDASAQGLGAILAQLDNDEKERAIYFASRGTTKSEKSYGATKLEALAVLWACQLFRHYLLGQHFDLYTDHNALKWLLNMKTPGSLFQRWILRLQV